MTTFEIPRPLKAEHDELHDTLRRATREAGEVGATAQAVAALMHPHFVKEEAFALPPLGLLGALASGPVTPAMRDVPELTDRLRAEWPQMLEEHKAIVAALEQFAAAARAAGRDEYVRFAHALMQHARTEEEVRYPAALLVGAHVRAGLPAA